MTEIHKEPTTYRASPLAAEAAEIGWSRDLESRSGVRFQVRPARPGDEGQLASFFRALTPQDLRHRFLTGLATVDPGRLKAMARNDDPHTISFLAFEGDRLIATAMLAAERDYRTAEFALSTLPDRKGKGVSWTLLAHLIDYARAAGIKRLESIETADDCRALRLEREMGFRTRLHPEDATVMIAQKELAPAGPGTPAAAQWPA